MDEDTSFFRHPASNLVLVWTSIASVGWYIFAVTVTLFCASPYIGEKYRSWRLRKDEEEYSAKYHKNPDLFEQRMIGVQAARQRMQEKNDELAEIAKRKKEEKEELKRQELLNLTKKLDGGRKLGSRDDGASTSTTSKLRDEYNPLMGDTSRRYRPPKRSCCKKSGCG